MVKNKAEIAALVFFLALVLGAMLLIGDPSMDKGHCVEAARKSLMDERVC